MLRHLLRKEFLLIAKTPMLFWMNTLYPIVLLCVVPFATSMDIKSLKTVILDDDRSSLSKELSAHFYQSGYFTPAEPDEGISSAEKAQEMIDKGKTDVIIEIVAGFEKNILTDNTADVLLKVNAVNATKGKLSNIYVDQIINNYKEELSQKFQPQQRKAIDFVYQTLYNPNSDYMPFVLPGLIAIVICMTAMVMPAISLVQEKELGTITQLNATPVKGYMVMLSKAFPYWIIIAVLMPFNILLVGIIHHVWPNGSIWAIEVYSILLGIAFSHMSLVLANYSSRLQQLMFMIIFFMFIILLMTGIFTPVEGMPIWGQLIAKSSPLYYYTSDIRTLYLRRGGFCDVWQGMIIVGVFAVGFALWALLSYRKQVS